MSTRGSPRQAYSGPCRLSRVGCAEDAIPPSPSGVCACIAQRGEIPSSAGLEMRIIPIDIQNPWLARGNETPARKRIVLGRAASSESCGLEHASALLTSMGPRGVERCGAATSRTREPNLTCRAGFFFSAVPRCETLQHSDAQGRQLVRLPPDRAVRANADETWAARRHGEVDLQQAAGLSRPDRLASRGGRTAGRADSGTPCVRAMAASVRGQQQG